MAELLQSEEKETCVKRPFLQWIRGFPVFSYYVKEAIEEIFDFTPADGDIIIASYPKTGTNWVAAILHQIMSNAEPLQSFTDLFFVKIPFLSNPGVSVLEYLTTTPRVYKHHYPFNRIKRNPNSKIIYIYRNPEDVVVSFHHYLNIVGFPTNLDDIFEDFLDGNLPFGSYFNHVLSYFDHNDDPNLFLISYEELQNQRRESILKVAKFVDEKYYNDLLKSETTLDKIIEHTSFEYMKKHHTLNFAKDPSQYLTWLKSSVAIPMKEVDYFRKGVVGDGKSLLNVTQLQRLRQKIRETVEQQDILARWLSD